MAISVGSVSVDVVPDVRGFAAELKTKLSGLTARIALEADTAKLRAQIDEVARDRRATIEVDADTAKAEAEIDAAARDRRAAIDTEVDGRGISGLLAGVLALGPALIPVTAAVVGLTAALGAPLAAAGGGLTVFGLIGGAAIARTNKVAKQIADLKKRADTLVDPKAAAQAAAQAKALEATLTGPQRAFLAAKDTFTQAFDTLVKSSGKDIFRPFNAGLRLLAAIMPALAPVIHSVSTAIADVLDSAGKSAKSGGLKSFLDFLAKASGPAITTFATILGNIAVGFGGLFAAFAPVGEKLTTKLVDLSDAFAGFGQNAGSNKGLQSFIGYVQQVGPQVASVLGAVVEAVVHLAVALAPFGGLVLTGIGLLAKLITAIPTPVLTILASVIGTVVIGLKLWAVAQAAIDALLAANPIGLVVLAIAGLVAGIILAYKHSETFRQIVDAAFRAVAAAIDFARDHWKLLITLILGPFGAAIVFIVDHFNAIRDVCRSVFKFIVDAFFTVVGALVHGAAKAFGWVPGIGGKLKDAADKFDQFRDSVNRALDGIHSVKTIRLNVTTKQIALNPSLAKPRGIDGAGATGAIINRPTVALIGEAGPEALVPLNQTPGNGPLPTGGIDAEQSSYRAFKRALADTGTVIMSKDNLDALDLLVGAA